MKRTVPIATALGVLCLTACGQPTQQELLEAQEAKAKYCDEMLADIKNVASDRPIMRASLQENYNRECLGKTYPEAVQ